MKISKKYHFYAAHRNEYLKDKCSSLHGHTYYVKVVLAINNIGESGTSILFKDIDNLIHPIIEGFDHATLINVTDTELLNALKPLKMKIKVFDFPTSAENLCKELFNNIKNVGLPVIEVALKETTSSEIVYP